MVMVLLSCLSKDRFYCKRSQNTTAIKIRPANIVSIVVVDLEIMYLICTLSKIMIAIIIIVIISIILGRRPIQQCWFTRGRPSINKLKHVTVSEDMKDSQSTDKAITTSSVKQRSIVLLQTVNAICLWKRQKSKDTSKLPLRFYGTGEVKSKLPLKVKNKEAEIQTLVAPELTQGRLVD